MILSNLRQSKHRMKTSKRSQTGVFSQGEEGYALLQVQDTDDEEDRQGSSSSSGSGRWKPDRNRRSSKMTKEKPVDFDTALARAGFGKFHYWLMFVCGWANASDAIEVLCISFLMPSAEHDLKLTSSEKGWLSAILFVGMLVGGYVWGSLSDVYGRKRTLMLAMVINALCGFVSSLSQEKTSFFVIRFLSGVGVGGSIPVVWTYFSEFQPPSKRGTMLSVLAAFWMVGNVFVALLAWLVIPRVDLGITSGPFLFNSWRIFTLLCGVPALLVAFMLTTLPESPKFLLKQKRPADALKILSQIFAANTGRSKSLFSVDQLMADDENDDDDDFDGNSDTDDIISDSSSDDEERQQQQKNNEPKIAGKSHNINNNVEKSGNRGNFLIGLVRLMRNTRALFGRKLWRVTCQMLYIHFSLAFGYYGLWLWFPTLFDKLNKYYHDHPNDSMSVCQITDYKPVSNVTIINGGDADPEDTGFTPPTADVFTKSIYISLAAAPANLWTMFHMDKLGRKFFLVSSLTLSGLMAFLVYLVRSEMANLLLSIAFGAVSTPAFNAIDCLSVEVFPTKLRGTGMSVLLIATRMGAILGNIAFGYFVETECAVPLGLVSALLVSGGLLGFFLPNTKGQALA